MVVEWFRSGLQIWECSEWAVYTYVGPGHTPAYTSSWLIYTTHLPRKRFSCHASRSRRVHAICGFHQLKICQIHSQNCVNVGYFARDVERIFAESGTCKKCISARCWSMRMCNVIIFAWSLYLTKVYIGHVTGMRWILIAYGNHPATIIRNRNIKRWRFIHFIEHVTVIQGSYIRRE